MGILRGGEEYSLHGSEHSITMLEGWRCHRLVDLLRVKVLFVWQPELPPPMLSWCPRCLKLFTTCFDLLFAWSPHSCFLLIVVAALSTAELAVDDRRAALAVEAKSVTHVSGSVLNSDPGKIVSQGSFPLATGCRCSWRKSIASDTFRNPFFKGYTFLGGAQGMV